MNPGVDDPRSARPVLLGNVGLLCSTTVWVAMFPVTEKLLETRNPLSVTIGRLDGGSLILLSVLLLSGGGRRLHSGMPWGRVMLRPWWALPRPP